MSQFTRILAAAILALGLAPAVAQAPAPSASPPVAQGQGRADVQGPERRASERGQERAQPEGRRLPPDAVTEHVVELPGRTLRFTAVAGSIPLTDRQGKLEAEIAYVAYVLAGGDRAARPVTFALNGGPGASSAYLHLGALGPWRVPLDGPAILPSASPALVPNAETWLDFTDLVFIDPVGTGYSRLANAGDELRQRYLSVDGDVEALSEFVTRWLKANGRMISPKFLVGESYGGFRTPLIADKLQTGYGVGLSGLVLVSPVLDFGWKVQPGHAPLPHVSLLPSLAAASLEKKGTVTRESLREVELYAADEYLADLLRGLQDEAAVDRVSRRVADYTGLDPALVRRLAGRVDMRTFQRELDRAGGRVASAYDTAVTALDPDPTATMSRFRDPVLEAMSAPLTSAMVDHLSRRLEYKADGRYRLLNGGVSSAWRWGTGRGQPEAVSELRNVLALDPRLRVLVVHGFTDLVTPYFESELILRQIRGFGPDGRVRLAVYPGGHMFYTREESRGTFRRDALALYRNVLGEAPAAAQ